MDAQRVVNSVDMVFSHNKGCRVKMDVVSDVQQASLPISESRDK